MFTLIISMAHCGLNDELSLEVYEQSEVTRVS